MGTSSQPREREYSASEEQWKAFVRSRVWLDFKRFILDSIDDGKDLLASLPDDRTVRCSDDYIRGGIAILGQVLEFPEVRLQDFVLEREEA